MEILISVFTNIWPMLLLFAGAYIFHKYQLEKNTIHIPKQRTPAPNPRIKPI